MLIKMIKTATVSGTEWKKGTLLEAVRMDAEKAIKDGSAEAVEATETKPDTKEIESLKAELKETKKQLEEANALNEELSKATKPK